MSLQNVHLKVTDLIKTKQTLNSVLKHNQFVSKHEWQITKRHVFI